MFEKEAEERGNEKIKGNNDLARCSRKAYKDGFKEGAEFGYNKANEWHYVKDGDLPKQDGNTCFSIDVLASNKKWVYYQFDSGKWFCGSKEVKVVAWKEIVLPKENE